MALYSCTTASVAEGSVGEAKEASSRLIGINTLLHVAPGRWIKKGVMAKNPIATNIKENSASQRVIQIILFPSFLR